MDTVAIVGVGLIGGSFALALRRAGFPGRILGVSSPATLQKAQALGVIDAGGELPYAVQQADLVYLSQPVGAILEVLPTVAAHLKPGALVTDAGSTKRIIVETAHRFLSTEQFIGGHPMAGKESQGVSAADAALFEGRPYLLTPMGGVLPGSPIFADFSHWIDRIGARRIVLSPEHHDDLVARISHVPQLASTALALLVSDGVTYGGFAQLAGPGLRDMIRLASSSYGLWGDIFATNQDQIANALDSYISILSELRDSLGRPEMHDRFLSASAVARTVRSVTP